MYHLSKPTISALVSVYKCTRFEEFSAAFNSVINASLIPDQIVIVLDGPISSTLYSYVMQLGKNEGIDILPLRTNSGLGNALRKGIDICKGDFIMRFDSDDINSFDRLRVQVKYLVQNDHVDIVGSYVAEYAPNSAGKLLIENIKLVPVNDKLIKQSMCYRNPLNHPTVLFRRASIQRIGSYENVLYFEDYFLWLKSRKAGLIFANLPEVLVLMSRSSILERRTGFHYLGCELNFVLLAFWRKLISLNALFILLLRGFLRLLPYPISLLKHLMFWRKSLNGMIYTDKDND